MNSDGRQLAALVELGGQVWSNRHHRITHGRAGHDEIRAARAAADAYRGGMTYAEIATAMRLTSDDVAAWLGPEGAKRS